MKDLIEILKKATGPDRELDLAIFHAVFGVDYLRTQDSKTWKAPLNYTESIDAALTLVPSGGWQVLLTAEGVSAAFVGRNEYQHGATPAIALCIAALKARDQDRSQR